MSGSKWVNDYEWDRCMSGYVVLKGEWSWNNTYLSGSKKAENYGIVTKIGK